MKKIDVNLSILAVIALIAVSIMMFLAPDTIAQEGETVIIPTSTPTCEENVSWCPLPPRPPTCWDGSDADGQSSCPPQPECGLPGQPPCSPLRRASTGGGGSPSIDKPSFIPRDMNDDGVIDYHPSYTMKLHHSVLNADSSRIEWLDRANSKWKTVGNWIDRTGGNTFTIYVQPHTENTGPYRWCVFNSEQEKMCTDSFTMHKGLTEIRFDPLQEINSELKPEQ